MRKRRREKYRFLPILKEESINIPKEIGKYLLDISKLIIGGVVITAALDIVSDKTVLIYMAVIIALAFGVCGIILFIYNNKRK